MTLEVERSGVFIVASITYCNTSELILFHQEVPHDQHLAIGCRPKATARRD